MRVLVLSPYADLIEPTLIKAGDTPIVRSADMEVSDWPEADFVISFGYRKIIQQRTLDEMPSRIINIHISLLPYNRGAAPNFWSWFDDTPKGVTIHEISAEIDKGLILAQHELHHSFMSNFSSPFTLRSTYNDLIVAAAGLLDRHWSNISNGYGAIPMQNKSKGSYHRAGDEDKFMKYLPFGYETPVHEVAHLGRIYRGEA